MSDRGNDPLARIEAALQSCWDCGQTFGVVREHAARGLVAVVEVREQLRQAHDLLRRLSEWDALHPPTVAPYGDGPYWLREIAKVQGAGQESGVGIECDGGPYCQARRHIHGCHADNGACDEPCEHSVGKPTGSSAASEELPRESGVKAESDGLSRTYFACTTCGATWSLAGNLDSALCPNCDKDVLRRPRRQAAKHTSGSAADQELALRIARLTENLQAANLRSRNLAEALVGVREQLRQAEAEIERHKAWYEKVAPMTIPTVSLALAEKEARTLRVERDAAVGLLQDVLVIAALRGLRYRHNRWLCSQCWRNRLRGVGPS